MKSHDKYLQHAIRLARVNVVRKGRPYGAVLVRRGQIISEACTAVHASGDPTDHAEMLAIRAAARRLGTTRLDGCTLYVSGQPCPMCLGAMYLTGISEVYFAYSNHDGELYNLTTDFIYEQLQKPFAEQKIRITHRPQSEPSSLYAEWYAHQWGEYVDRVI